MLLNTMLLLGALMFCVGLFVVFTRKNAIMVLIGIELMLNSANLNLVTFSRFDPQALQGQIFSLFVITIAAAEAAVGLAIVIRFFQIKESIHIDDAVELQS